MQLLKRMVKTLPPVNRLVRQRRSLLKTVADQKVQIVNLQGRVRELDDYLGDSVQMWPPGHFYSPVPSMQDIARFDSEHPAAPGVLQLSGIDINEEGQLEMIRKLAKFYAPELLPKEPQPGHRYYWLNEFFSYADAALLQTMLRFAAPKRIVEVGSGFSSALILDTRDAFLGPGAQCTFIEPNPDRLELLLRDEDRDSVDILVSPVQEIDQAVFQALEANDVLFIDSSHVSKVASDVNWLLFSVLPRLNPGVYIHVHDIFYPFEYPSPWIHEGRGWTEAYLLRAFLEFNAAFEIVLFNSYLREFHRNEVALEMPLWDQRDGGSLWLRRNDH